MRYVISNLLWCLAFCYVIVAAPAQAQGIIRDAEVEASLRTIATPIFKQAGLNPDQIRLVILGDDSINAFVAGGQNLFINSGLILDAKNVGELGGVIAHEAGHMAGGHLIRLRGQMERASAESIISTIAGLAVGIGAGDTHAGLVAGMGGAEYARRNFLRHSRVFESSADHAGMTTIEALGYSTQGMADFLERLSGQEILPEMQRSGYIMTHPLSRDRLATVEDFVARSRHKNDPWPAAWEELYQRLQAKILAFTRPGQAQIKYQNDDSFAGRYALVIAAYRQGHIAEALQSLTALEKLEPANPYLPELRGQILFEQGRNAEAITAYRKASTLAPKSGLIHLSLAQALLQQESGAVDEALSHLLKARVTGEKDTPLVYRWMAVAYGRSGKEGMAKLALAEEALLKGDPNFAVQQATRAKELLPADDTASRQRVADLLVAAEKAKKDKKRD